MSLRVGSLFSGIGGLDLGFERAGATVAWQCEIDPHARAVLAKHWPDVRVIDDVKLVGTHAPFDMCPPECEEGCEREIECIGIAELQDDELAIDALVGGFPCQDISNAGTTHAGGLAGLDGKRSGLWREFYRVIRSTQPRWVVVENVGALTVRGLDAVLGDLADGGYDAEWAVLSAAALGSSHLRKRLFIVGWRPDLLSDADRARLEGNECRILAQPSKGRQDADATRPTGRSSSPRVRRGIDGVSRRLDGTPVTFAKGESVSHRKERLRELGNAVSVPVAEWIARRIVAIEHLGESALQKAA